MNRAHPARLVCATAVNGNLQVALPKTSVDRSDGAAILVGGDPLSHRSVVMVPSP